MVPGGYGMIRRHGSIGEQDSKEDRLLSGLHDAGPPLRRAQITATFIGQRIKSWRF